jgi:large subunit ribosomal protein L13
LIAPSELRKQHTWNAGQHPTRVVEKAVRGMLPKNRLGRALFGNLHVYAGAEHPHAAQNPKAI